MNFVDLYKNNSLSLYNITLKQIKVTIFAVTFTLKNKLHIILLEAESFKIFKACITYPLTAVLQIPSDTKNKKEW